MLTSDNGSCTVQFLQPWRGYQTGELAGFKKELTAKLISSGVAVKISKSKVTKPHKATVTKG